MIPDEACMFTTTYETADSSATLLVSYQLNVSHTEGNAVPRRLR